MSYKRQHSHNPILMFIGLVSALIVVGLAFKKLMDMKREWEGGSKEQGLVNDVVRLATKVQTEVLPQTAKSQPAKAVKPAKFIAPKIEPLNLNQRQEKIYNMIRTEGEMTMPMLTKELSQVSSRTLRRDMLVLENLGLIMQTGRTKNSVYKLLR